MDPVQPHEISYPGHVVRPTGRFRALLVGINYPGSRAALRGCVNDALNMKKLLLRSGFVDDSSHMVVLSDDRGDRRDRLPTASNIRKGMQWLIHNSSPGDILFFHFSGHGAQVPDKSGMEEDGHDETILPCDYENSGQIRDDEIWGTMVYPLPAGVKLTAVMDCCHSGTGMDLPLDYNLKKNAWKEDTNPCYGRGDVVLFSGCEDEQTSADVGGGGGGMGKLLGGGGGGYGKREPGGAMTQCFIAALQQNPMPTYSDLIGAVRSHLKRRGFSQTPQLTSNQRFMLESRVFVLTDGIEGNQNREVGMLQRKKMKKGKAKNKGLDIGGLFIGAAVVGSLFF